MSISHLGVACEHFEPPVPLVHACGDVQVSPVSEEQLTCVNSSKEETTTDTGLGQHNSKGQLKAQLKGQSAALLLCQLKTAASSSTRNLEYSYLHGDICLLGGARTAT